jgi:hypothetical protein
VASLNAQLAGHFPEIDFDRLHFFEDRFQGVIKRSPPHDTYNILEEKKDINSVRVSGRGILNLKVFIKAQRLDRSTFSVNRGNPAA